ncbi:MAG: NAD(P)/FAD-dependent oxidoreductase [Dehalococcoidia bacterium]
MYDAIVVGARCAGSPTAMLLARKGHRVLVLDRDTFPSDIMSTHFIQLQGVVQLEKWGLLDAVKATNCPPIPKTIFHIGDVAVSPPLPPELQGVVAYCPRRTVLDKILVDAAREAGAEVREGFSVKELLFEGDTVVGVRGRDKTAGTDVEERAKITIGADGMHSTVARAVNAPAYNEKPSLSCAYYSYFSNVHLDGAELFLGENGGCLAFPTNDGLACIAVGQANEKFDEFRSDIEGNFYRYLDLISADMAQRVRAGKREERWIGTADVPNFFKKPYGPGWALVGDAGYHKDPVTGLGIMDCFRDAELLADAIDDGFAGREPLEQALSGYQAKRDEAALPMYELTTSLVSGTTPPEIFQGLAAAAAQDG